MNDYTQGWIDALKWAEEIAGQDNASLAIRDKILSIRKDLWKTDSL